MDIGKEKILKDASVATRATYENAVNTAKAMNSVSDSAWNAAKAIDAIHEDWCAADYEKAAEAAKAIDAIRNSSWDAVRDALDVADYARAAYTGYMAR